MPKHRINAIIALMIIIMPLAAFFLLKLGGNPKFKPVLKVYDISEKGDTLLRRLPDSLLFYDVHGSTFTRSDMQGKVWLIHFITPESADSVIRLKDKVACGNIENEFYDNVFDADYIKILTVTTSPVSNETLQAFYRKMNVKPEKWVIVTGSKSEIWKLGKTHLKLPEFNGLDTTTTSPFAVTHAVMVDKEGYIRGFYDKYDNANYGFYDVTELGVRGMRTIVEDIRALVTMEYMPKNKK